MVITFKGQRGPLLLEGETRMIASRRKKAKNSTYSALSLEGGDFIRPSAEHYSSHIPRYETKKKQQLGGGKRKKNSTHREKNRNKIAPKSDSLQVGGGGPISWSTGKTKRSPLEAKKKKYSTHRRGGVKLDFTKGSRKETPRGRGLQPGSAIAAP